jgi:tetratricopeptide (TPR) repeat protein
MISETLDKARALYASGNYDAALGESDKYEKQHELTTEMLLLKGRLIQLSESGKRPLSEAKECFLIALRQDKENINALLEIGWICTSVIGEAEEGREYFSKVIEKCSALSAEATRGLKGGRE